MNNNILLVDDDINLLNSLNRNLEKKFNITTVTGGMEGIKEIDNKQKFAVIIADMMMPGMNGIEFLTIARQKTPDSIRMMITGKADLGIAVNAINAGNIFRFIVKPVSHEDIAKIINAGIKQYDLISVEKELLEKTLRGSIKILTEILSILNPHAFSKTSRIIRLAKKIAKKMHYKNLWQIEIAAMLSQIGYITIPEEILLKLFENEALSTKETQLINSCPEIAYTLISKIPRMNEIAEIIRYQNKRYDGGDIPLGSRILKVVNDFDTLSIKKKSTQEILLDMKNRKYWYDPVILNALTILYIEINQYNHWLVSVKKLKSGMIIAEKVINKFGQLLVEQGQEVTEQLILRLKNYELRNGELPNIKVYSEN